MQNFISRVVDLLDVGRNKYQIGLAQYGGQGHTEFLLNTYQTRDEMTAHIRDHFLPRGGSRRTGKALRYLHQTFFQEAAGSRFLQGVPQYAVVMTSGKSEDEFWDAAQKLREKGVKVMSVGVQDFDRRELEGMATPPLVYEMEGQDGVRQLMQDVGVVIQGTRQPGFGIASEKEPVLGKILSLHVSVTGRSQKLWGRKEKKKLWGRAEKGRILDSSVQGYQHQWMGKRRWHGLSSGTYHVLVNYDHSEAAEEAIQKVSGQKNHLFLLIGWGSTDLCWAQLNGFADLPWAFSQI